MKRTGILKMLLGFIVVFFIASILIMVVEPSINNLADAL